MPPYIPVPDNSLTILGSIPAQIKSARATINASDLMNSSNNLSDYLDLLCSYVHETHPVDTMPELLVAARTVPFIESEHKIVPWKEYPAKEGTWFFYDEMLASVASASWIYHELTIDNLTRQFDSDIPDETWKRSNNLLKQSFSLFNAFQTNTSDDCHGEGLGYIYHANSILIQLIVIMRDVHTTYREIDADFGAFNKVHSNVGTFRRILVFIYNESTILLQSKRYAAVNTQALEILYCYYTALEYYAKNSLGVALGLIQYALVNSIEQDPIKNRFGLKSTKVKERPLLNDNVKLIHKFRSNLPPLYQKLLITLSKILKILYWKIGKENDSLSFDTVPSSKEIKHSYLFGSNDLPTGLQIPLTSMPVYRPACFGVSSAPVHNYF